LKRGIYALTGANGSGKSSLFRILLSCDTNKKSIDLPQSIIVQNKASISLLGPSSSDMEVAEVRPDGSQIFETTGTNLDLTISSLVPKIVMPSSDVVEISQNVYWPLHTKPIDWMYQEMVSEMSEPQRSELVSRVEHELSLFQFQRDVRLTPSGKETDVDNKDTIESSPVLDSLGRTVANDLLEEKDDWFNELSGGQKCKVELVRKVRVLDRQLENTVMPVPFRPSLHKNDVSSPDSD